MALTLLGLLTAVLVVTLAVRVRQLRGAIRQTSPVVLTEGRVRDIVRSAEPITAEGTVVRACRTTDAAAVRSTVDDVVLVAMGWPAVEPARNMSLHVAAGNLEHWALVTVADTGELIGVVTLDPLRRPPGDTYLGAVQVGFWAGPTGRGRGHMKVAVAALADVLLRHRIALVAETAVDNAAGRRLLEHAVMEAVAERTRRLPDGREIASVVYQRTPG